MVLTLKDGYKYSFLDLISLSCNNLLRCTKKYDINLVCKS